MRQLRSMKEGVRERLSLSAKLRLKRIVFVPVVWTLKLAARLYNFAGRVAERAAANGFDLRRAWDVKAKPRELHGEPWSASDFLLLMRAGQQRQSLDADRAIRASVIIPVFNKVEFTFQCLRSLLREIDFDDTEVIIVNNYSTDETGEVLSHFASFVRVIDNGENCGFVDACNQGAAAARGRFLVFLNNDTIVQPGWLEPLVETVEDNESVGAVGSMFLYPDGRVQEAGAIIWRDGAALHYGWGKSPEDDRYCFAREVDYCSGASLLVRRELFEQLGGFDRRYAPTYYEDADLCFGVRSLGYKVVYQPASRVVRFEGATAGTDTGAGFKRFQTVNREKFFVKWRDTLEREQPAHEPSNVLRASNRKRGPHIIIFDDRVPTPDRDAGSARMMFILKSLATWSRPVFVSLGKRIWLDYEKLLWKEGIETACAPDYPRILKERKFSAALLSRPDVAEAVLPALRRSDPRLKIVFDMVDAYFIRLEREHQLTGDTHMAEEALQSRELETRLARACDLIWCASPEDRKVMEREAPGIRSADIPTIHRLHERGEPFDKRSGLLFVGNFTHRPNSDGISFYMREVHPHVRASLPDIQLQIAGAYATPAIMAYAAEGVRVLGYVRDLGPLFHTARVFVAPIRFGAGVKGKIGDALSYGLPVVTTSIGAEGMNLTHDAEVLIADTPQAFADCVVRAYRERETWQRLSDRGYKHVAEHLTPQIVGEIINNSIRELLD